MNKEEAEEFTQNLGQIFSGGFRFIAQAGRLGVPKALGLTTEQWVHDRLGGYVKLPREDRREAALELAASGHSTREIGEALGVDHATAARDVANATAGEQKRNDNNDDGVANATETVANAPNGKTTRELLSQSDQNDWRTPRKYLDAARNVMGGIDLDPASSAEANETVEAARFYTEKENGLEQPWKGSVWLNPPYGGNARLFIERLIKEYEVGNVTAACTLLNSHPTETKWFQRLFDYTVCFIAGRIDFGGPSREVASTSTHGSAVVYLGKEPDLFAKTFMRFGAVVRKIQ